jgi:hypothetical protein
LLLRVGLGQIGRRLFNLRRCFGLVVGDLPRRFVAANAAGAVEVCAGLDHQLGHADLTRDLAGGDDLQSLGFDLADKRAADQDPPRLDLAVDHPGLTDDDLGFGVDCAFQLAVDVQIVL